MFDVIYDKSVFFEVSIFFLKLYLWCGLKHCLSSGSKSKMLCIEDLHLDTADEDRISTKEILEIKLEAMEIALEELNEKQAICIKAFYLEKRCYDEISKMEGLTLNEVKSHIQNGKRNLKMILSKLFTEK